VDLEGQTQAQLPGAASLAAQITPDGRYVYYLNELKLLGKTSLLTRQGVRGFTFQGLYKEVYTAPYRVNCGAFTPDCTVALLGGGELPPVPGEKPNRLEVIIALGVDGRLKPKWDGGEKPTGTDCVLRLLDLQTGQVVARLEGHTAPLVDVAVSADGGLALSCSLDGEARLWDLRQRRSLRRLGDPDVFFLFGAFTPDGRQVLTASADHHLRLWDVATGAQRRVYTGHTHTVRSLAISPDGAWALSCGGDIVREGSRVTGKGCHIFAWDLRGGKELFRFNDPAHLMDKVGISPDGRRVVSVRRADADCLYLWDLGPTGPLPPPAKE
jgi:hypothetical protein